LVEVQPLDKQNLAVYIIAQMIAQLLFRPISGLNSLFSVHLGLYSFQL